MGATMFDYPHNKIRVKPIIDRCRSAWCAVCRKLEFRKKVIPRLKEAANLWAGVRKLVITTDPKRFPEGCTADVLDELLREKSDFERRLKEKYHGKIYFMFSWIEFQESGFPHWHYIIFTDQKGKRAMIGQDLVHELWDRYLSDEDLKKSNQWIHEGFFHSKNEYLTYMGYAEKTGYFIKEKAHQVQLPPLLMASKRKVRAYYFSIKFGESLMDDDSELSDNNSVSTEITEKNEESDLQNQLDKEKINRSFEICPKNWRDRFGSGWRSRYTEEELKSIGDEIRNQERAENNDSEDQGISLDMRNDLSNEEKQAKCGKRIKFLYFTENFKYLDKSEFFPYDDKVTFKLREKYLVEENGKGLFLKDHIHDKDDAILELSSAYREAYKDRQNKAAEKLIKKERPELVKILNVFNQVFPGAEITIRKKREDQNDDERFAPYLDYDSSDEYLNRE
jgi:hypothetical protein